MHVVIMVALVIYDIPYTISTTTFMVDFFKLQNIWSILNF